MSTTVQKSIQRHQTNKAITHLLGMVEGMIADDDLHEKEVQLLSTWFTENPVATTVWPGNIIAKKLRDVLADGVISSAERLHLLSALAQLTSSNFAETGSVTAEPSTLPIDDCVTVELRNAGVCLTGDFLYGTRAACERLVLRAGAMPMDTVTRKVDILVIGTQASPNWAHMNFGRKIQRAVELQEQGFAIEIISERRLLEVIGG